MRNYDIDKPIVQIKRRPGVYYRSDNDTSVQSC